MRNQLTVIHAIDKYLRGVLNEAETQEFENRLKTDTQLQQEVAKQELLMEAIKRSALKASAVKGKKKYKTIKTLKYVGVLVAAAAITAASFYFVNHNNSESETESNTELGIEALPTQGYELNTAQDTVIETENGSVFAIPADAFETENGEAVTGKVSFEIKEAFEDLDIMKAGLTTTSNGELLETGGMFFLDATQNGQKLRLKKGKEILSQLPNLHPDKNMKLFDGEKQPDGTINWVNPKEFEKDLITVDITSLDFYPKGYVEELSQTKKKVLVRAEGDLPTERMTTEQAKVLGYKYPPKLWAEDDAVKLGMIIREYKDVVKETKVYSKHFTDSLYYSFARLFEERDYSMADTNGVVEKRANKKSGSVAKKSKINPVKWSFKTSKISKDEYYVIADAIIDQGWRVFSSKNNKDELIPTELNIISEGAYKVVGDIEERGIRGLEFNSVFGEKVGFFRNKASFARKIKVLGDNVGVKGSVYFMTCDDDRCLPPESIAFYLPISTLENDSTTTESSLCPIPSGINPAKVKAIWNKKFNKTILATKEFEERMKVIHESHQDRILEVYVNNLDRPLWYSDSIAMGMCEYTTKKFRGFYNQRKGGVKVNDRLANKLTDYFTKKHKEFTSATSKAFQEYEKKKQQLRKEFAGKNSKKIQEEVNRQFKVFT
ncbi:MAG: hypothetical protein ACPGVD_11965, partial [Flavobacteriales bacterium]